MSVTATRVVAASSAAAVTVAPGTASPSWSITATRMLPVVVTCAYAPPEQIAASRRAPAAAARTYSYTSSSSASIRFQESLSASSSYAMPSMFASRAYGCEKACATSG